MSAAGTDLQWAADGCVLPNVPIKPYRLIYRPACEHTKARFAEIVIMAESAEAALEHGRSCIALAGMRLSHARAER